MVLQNDRLHVQLSEFVQSQNKRARMILTLDTTGGRAKQGNKKKPKQSTGASSKAPGAKKKPQHAFFTDVSKKSCKLTFVKNSFDFVLELNQRLRAHRAWHLLLLLLHPAPHGAHNKAVKRHVSATSTAGMATVDLGPVAEALLRGEECTLPVDFVKSVNPEASADVAVAADHLLCRGQVTLHLVKQKELAAIRKHNAEVREAAMKLKSASNQQDPEVVKDQVLLLFCYQPHIVCYSSTPQSTSMPDPVLCRCSGAAAPAELA